MHSVLGLAAVTHRPRTVGTLYFVSAPDCPVDHTTIFVNPTSEEKWC